MTFADLHFTVNCEIFLNVINAKITTESEKRGGLR